MQIGWGFKSKTATCTKLQYVLTIKLKIIESITQCKKINLIEYL